MEFLSQFDYEVEYQTGKSNVDAGALSRRRDHNEASVNVVSQVSNIDIIDHIKECYQKDPICVTILKNNDNLTKSKETTVKDGLMYKKDRILIPNVSSIKTKILQEYQNIPISGHVGVAKTIELVSRQFYRNNMYEEIHEYVTLCLKCQANKSSNMLPSGLLQSLPIAF